MYSGPEQRARLGTYFASSVLNHGIPSSLAGSRFDFLTKTADAFKTQNEPLSSAGIGAFGGLSNIQSKVILQVLFKLKLNYFQPRVTS